MNKITVNTIEGQLADARDISIAIVASRFNQMIVDNLIAGACDGLIRHGVSAQQIDVVRTPGAFELPQAAQRVIKSARYSGVIALGAVIAGDTPHFTHVATACTSGLQQVALASDVPLTFGVLTTDSIEQAIARAGTKAGNKGYDAALSLLEMVSLLKALDCATAL